MGFWSKGAFDDRGDRHGRRPVFLACVSLFALGSVVIALAPSFAVLLLGRAIQGVGGGGIIPTASAVIGDSLSAGRRARALGLMGATYGMAFVLGPPLAAVLMLAFSWQWIFLANVPIAAAVLLFGARSLPNRRHGVPLAPLDAGGIALLTLLLTLLVLGITRAWAGDVWPWLLVGALPVGVLLVRHQRRVEARGGRPMVPVSLFSLRQLRLTYSLTLGAGFGMGAIVFLATLATQAHAVDRSHVGFALLPMVLASMVGSMGSARALARVGTRAVVASGFGFLVLGYFGVAWVGLGFTGYLLASVPVGLGVGVAVGGALRSLALDESPVTLRGAAQGLVNIFTSIGTLLAVSVMGSVADLAGGGVAGLSLAYESVAVLMLGMTAAAWALREPGLRNEMAGAA